MQPSPSEPRRCRVCGAELQPEFRYCPNCGTQVSTEPEPSVGTPPTERVVIHPAQEPDPSTLETREIPLDEVPSTGPAAERAPEPEWGPATTTVPPESGNRTLWIIVGIIAAIVLICCCLLPLALFAVASVDTAFQDEIRSFTGRARL